MLLWGTLLQKIAFPTKTTLRFLGLIGNIFDNILIRKYWQKSSFMSIEKKVAYCFLFSNSCVSQNSKWFSLSSCSTEQHVHINVFYHSTTIKYIFLYSIFSQVPPVVPPGVHVPPFEKPWFMWLSSGQESFRSRNQDYTVLFYLATRGHQCVCTWTIMCLCCGKTLVSSFSHIK